MVLPSCRGCPPAFFFCSVNATSNEANVSELSIFIDESGGQNGHSLWCLAVMVFHDQTEDLGPALGAYESNLCERSLPDVPFHASPLMYGKGQYETFSLQEHKRIG